MGLFDKKNCDICGEKIGLLGNRKLSDGNMCKNCAGKLSPFFVERKQSSIADIKTQLAYRERNKADVAAFHVTRTMGTMTKILVDERTGKFMVTSASDLEKANPDVIDLNRITDCRLDIRESKSELRTTGSDGKPVSYNPPRYKYTYQFYVAIFVDHPYFDKMEFKLNDRDCSVETGMVSQRNSGFGFGARQLMTGVNPYADPDYGRFEQMGNEIIKTLLSNRQFDAPSQPFAAVRSVSAPEAPAAPVITKCPFCGAEISSGVKFCEYCGSKLL